MTLTAEDLLAGAAVTRDVAVPAALLASAGRSIDETDGALTTVVLRPLTVRDLQQIARAGEDDDGLSAALMIQQALVRPSLSFDQVARLPAGLARFLVERINEISGVDAGRDELAELVQTPLARACFVLAKEFGWTPEEVSGMTIGQILLYLEMSRAGDGQR
jgi:hypothetical protein